MKYTSPEIIAKATQKRSQYHRHGRDEVLPFVDWMNARLRGLQKAGATVKTCTVSGIYFIQITWGKAEPKVYTESDFMVEYEDTYLASFGLNCKIPI